MIDTFDNPDLEGAKGDMRKNSDADGITPVNIQNASIEEAEYVPMSKQCEGLDTMVPVNMRFEMYKALETIDRKVNGVDYYVQQKLKYPNLKAVCKAFAREQVDALAVAIYNIEQKGQAIILGDATGIGKGRVAAGLIRYAFMSGRIPFFMTEKPNLFSDIYRDLIEIGSDGNVPLYTYEGDTEKPVTFNRKDIESMIREDIDTGEYDLEYSAESLFSAGNEDLLNRAVAQYREILAESGEMQDVPQYERNEEYEKQYKKKDGMRPFIINGRSKKTEIQNMNRDIIYQAHSDTNDYIKKGEIPQDSKVILATYSQFSSAKMTTKKEYLQSIAPKCIFILDESHNASGSSNTGIFLRECLSASQGALFLSATFAKRPDNMPIYASKTAIGDAGMNDEALIAAIQRGGVALQEIISSQLVSEGQMLRRQHSYQGVQTDYIYLDSSQQNARFNLEEDHKAKADRITEIVRKIIAFQNDYVAPVIADMDKQMAAEQKSAGERKGVAKGGVDNVPVFSGIFNLINQMLFSIKCEAVADFAIEEMKRGRKPIIAFASTMESFLNQLTKDDGTLVQVGDIIKHDFSLVLKRRLAKVLDYTVTNPDGNTEKATLTPEELGEDGYFEYNSIMELINSSSTDMHISPIDVILHRVEKAGFRAEEATGRSRKLKIRDKNTSQIARRKTVKVNEAFNRFNNNEIDCLLINQSAATGASAQAKPTDRVNKVPDEIPTSLEPRNEVKQRVMIVLQAELDINKEVQKRGRIFRTGQVYLPVYKYVSSAIPAEKRLMMMLQKKLKSLDANTSSNQKESSQVLSTLDFLNKYGDKIVQDYLIEHPAINDLLDDPLKLRDEKEREFVYPDGAHKTSGRVAILSTKDQEMFYSEIGERYSAEIELLDQMDANDLEVKSMNLEAKTIDRQVAVASTGGEGGSVFTRHAILEKCEVNNLRKPYTRSQVETLIKDSLSSNGSDGKSVQMTPEEKQEWLIEKAQKFLQNRADEEVNDIQIRYKALQAHVHEEKAILKIKNKTEQAALIASRKAELYEMEKESIEIAKRRAGNVFGLLRGTLDFFRVKRSCAYPGVSFAATGEWKKAIFIGFQLNEKAKNPFAPSAIKARFAIAGSEKYLAIPLSKQDIILQIEAATRRNVMNYEDFLSEWDGIIRQQQNDRTVRYIVTGNVMLALGKLEYAYGKLVSYTVEGGGVKKGVLMPEEFSTQATGEKGEHRITVPIKYVLPILKGMSDGASIYTNQTVSFQKRGSYFYVVMKGKTRDIKPVMEDLIGMGWFEEPEFVLRSGEWRNSIEARKIDNLVEYLQDKYKYSVDLTANQFDQIKDSFVIHDGSEDVIDVNGETAIIDRITKEETDLQITQETEAEMLKEAEESAGEEKRVAETRRARANTKVYKLASILGGMSHGGERMSQTDYAWVKSKPQYEVGDRVTVMNAEGQYQPDQIKTKYNDKGFLLYTLETNAGAYLASELKPYLHEPVVY